MKNILFFLVTLTILIASCTEDPGPEPNLPVVSIENTTVLESDNR